MFVNALMRAGVPFLIDTVKKMLLNSTDENANTAGKALEKVVNPPTNLELKKALVSYDKVVIQEVNKSLQKEVESSDKFIGRMRPTFGYVMAFTWFSQMMGIAYLMVFETQKVSDVVKTIADLSMMWSVGLSVLGVYVYKRSEEKKQG